MEKTKIAVLMDQTRSLEKSEENQRRIRLWKPSTNTSESYWHARPADSLSSIPFTIEPEHEMWGKILGFDLDRYYTDGKAYLHADLDMKVYRFENFLDGSPVGRSVSIWMGSGFEAALFGVEQAYAKDKDPWVGREPVLQDKKGLANLPVPDFFESPPMKLAHRMYRDIRALLDDDFQVIMPDWCRGPFGIACHLRGMDKIVMDMIEDPSFVHDLMRRTTDARKKWVRQRADFMGAPVQPAALYNDEVGVPLLSPRFYEKFVLPYEIELSEFFGGITYWHSCGNIVPFQKMIQAIPHVEMIHISPWSDLDQSVANLRGSDIALEVVLHALRDVQSAPAEQITSYLTRIREVTRGVPVTVRADALQLMSSVEEDVKKIKLWAEIAKSLLG